MKQRKWMSVIALLLVMILTFCACSSGEVREDTATTEDTAAGESESSTEESAAPQKPTVAEADIKVGCVTTNSYDNSGYDMGVYQGFQKVQELYPEAEYVWVDNVPDSGNECATVIENMIDDGCNIIIAASFGYLSSVEELAHKYPDVYFCHCSQGPVLVENMTRYDITTYEASYVLGYLAGKMTKTNDLGYVGSQPIPTVTSSVNAFALGAKAANPDAKVSLFWTNSWSDPSLEKEAAEGLMQKGCDVLIHFTDPPTVIQVVEDTDQDVYSIGFYLDQGSYGPTKCLSSFVYKWENLFPEFIEDYMNGTWKGIEIWSGMSDGYADIAPINEGAVPADIIEETMDIRQQILDGTLQVYAGEIKDNEGNVRVEEGGVLSDDELIMMDWLVDNVTGV